MGSSSDESGDERDVNTSDKDGSDREPERHSSPAVDIQSPDQDSDEGGQSSPVTRKRHSSASSNEKSPTEKGQEGNAVNEPASSPQQREVAGSDDSDDEGPRGTKNTTKDMFGSDSEEERDAEKTGRESPDQDDSPAREKPTEEELLRSQLRLRRDSDEDDVQRGSGDERQVPVEEPEVRIEADIPRMVANLGSELYFVKFPNFLSVDTHPYDPAWYEDEIDDDEALDDEGKHRLKLKVENTIRWKNIPDSSGVVQRESNARVVRWSDGSYSLHLGSEIFDIHRQKLLKGENNHLFVRQGFGLQGQAVFKEKLTFRPHSTDSNTHKKMTISLAEKSNKGHKVCMMPIVGFDPEAHRSEMIKKEEDRLKASIRRENKQRRVRERSMTRLNAHSLEPEDDEEGGISLSAIKNKYKYGSSGGAYSQADSDDSDDDASDLDIGKRSANKTKKAKIEESDDDDD